MFIVSIKKLEEITEYLGTIATIDFFNYKKLGLNLITFSICVFLPSSKISFQECLHDELINNTFFYKNSLFLKADSIVYHHRNYHRFGIFHSRLICAYKGGIIAIWMERCADNALPLRFFFYFMRFSCTWSTIKNYLKWLI